MAEPLTMPSAPAAPERDALLATKLHVPRPRPGFLARPRLLDRLTEATARELTLVSAPAGFGKTSLLGEWARRSRRPVAWLSLDAGDSDPARFWRYVAAALDGVRPGIGQKVAGLLHGAQQPPLEAVVTAIVNELDAAPDEVVLVLDDYHLVEGPPVHDSLAVLLERPPAGLRLVVASRADPPLPLARLRARGQMVEVRQRDLRFTVEEATALLEAAGLRLPADSVAALAARTEGWVAGSQLAGLSLQGHTDPVGFVAAFSGSHRYVLDYLAEEVLDRQPEEVRGFLLETSVLQRLSGPLCDAVTGRGDGQRLLERVERANLFLVPLDEVRGWWRYHHLFADLLRARLAAEQPERAAELHHAAATWCQEHGLLDDAIGHALDAGDPDWAARLIEQRLDQTLRRGEGVMLRRWLAALPAEVLRSRPGLVLAQALREMHRGRLGEAEHLLQHADRAVGLRSEPEQSGVPTDGGMVAQVPAAIALLRAELAAGREDPEQTARFARAALAHISQEERGPRLWARWLLAMADWLAGRVEQAEPVLVEVLAEGRAVAGHHPLLSSCFLLGGVQRAQGRLGAALATFQEGLELAVQDGQPSTFHAAEAHVGLGQVLYERNQLDEALRHLEEGLALSRPLGWLHLSDVALVTMAWIRQATGDPAGALRIMNEACALMPGTRTPTWYQPAPAEQARLLLAQGQIDQAARWTEKWRLGTEDEVSYLRERHQLLLARVLLAQGDADRALRLLQRLAALAEDQRRSDSLIRIRAVRARGLQAAGDHDAAVAELAGALALAAPEGYVRVFLEEGAAMAALLDGLAAAAGKGEPAAGVPPAYLGRLLRALQRDGVPVGRHGRRAAEVVPGLLEPLSERELEVLQLLAAGRSNQAIAKELVIALSTVKRHVSHILDKLGAANRTQAVARARELGLLR